MNWEILERIEIVVALIFAVVESIQLAYLYLLSRDMDEVQEDIDDIQEDMDDIQEDIQNG